MEELNRKVVIKYIFTPDFLSKIDRKDGLGCLYTLVNCKLQCRRPLSEKQRQISFNVDYPVVYFGHHPCDSCDSDQAKTSLMEAQLFVGQAGPPI